MAPARPVRLRAALPSLRSVGLVALGGAGGALARVGLSLVWPEGGWPTATLVENLVGAFALGALLTVLTELLPTRPDIRPLLGTGLLGAFTTFSTLALELQQALVAGRVALAAGYTAASLVGGVLAALAGIVAARALVRRRAAA